MSTSVYRVNKGINRPIEFKGLKAQYIWWLGGGLVALLILFAILYIAGVNTFVCLIVIVGLATWLFLRVYQLSRKYGEHGMMKVLAKRSIPGEVKTNSRRCYTTLCKKR